MNANAGSRCFYVEGFVQLLWWLREDVRGLFTETAERWFKWGYVFEGRSEVELAIGWYILIRLPSYAVKDHPWTRKPAWYQSCLLFYEPIPAGPGGWRVDEIMIEEFSR